MVFGWFKKRDKPIDADAVSKALYKVVGEYGDFISQHPSAGAIIDESALPHKKEQILSAIFLSLKTLDLGENVRSALHNMAMSLALFQKNVGAEPLYPLGVNIGALNDAPAADVANLILSNPAGKERYDTFKPLMDADFDRIQKMMDEAERGRTP